MATQLLLVYLALVAVGTILLVIRRSRRMQRERIARAEVEHAEQAKKMLSRMEEINRAAERDRSDPPSQGG